MKLELSRSNESSKSKKYSSQIENAYGFLTAIIPLLGFVLFAVLPIVISSIYSFQEYIEYGAPFELDYYYNVGWENYKTVLSDPFFWKALGNTFINCLVTPFCMLFGLIIALIVSNTKLIGRNFFKALFFIPYVCSIVASCLIWVCLLETDGPLYEFLCSISLDWVQLNNPHFARPFMVFLGVWSGVGFSVIMYTAALTNTDSGVIEAGKIDGANKWQSFWHITFPSIMPVTFFLLVTGIIGNLQDFTRFSLVGGYETADGAYVTAAYYLYHYLDPASFKLGIACAASWILAIVVLVVTVSQFIANRKQGDTTK